MTDLVGQRLEPLGIVPHLLQLAKLDAEPSLDFLKLLAHLRRDRPVHRVRRGSTGDALLGQGALHLVLAFLALALLLLAGRLSLRLPLGLGAVPGRLELRDQRLFGLRPEQPERPIPLIRDPMPILELPQRLVQVRSQRIAAEDLVHVARRGAPQAVSEEPLVVGMHPAQELNARTLADLHQPVLELADLLRAGQEELLGDRRHLAPQPRDPVDPGVALVEQPSGLCRVFLARLPDRFVESRDPFLLVLGEDQALRGLLRRRVLRTGKRLAEAECHRPDLVQDRAPQPRITQRPPGAPLLDRFGGLLDPLRELLLSLKERGVFGIHHLLLGPRNIAQDGLLERLLRERPERIGLLDAVHLLERSQRVADVGGLVAEPAQVVRQQRCPWTGLSGPRGANERPMVVGERQPLGAEDAQTDFLRHLVSLPQQLCRFFGLPRCSGQRIELFIS